MMKSAESEARECYLASEILACGSCVEAVVLDAVRSNMVSGVTPQCELID